jgi:amino acid adenylation domain-containing protein/FkbH-like protein
MFWGYVNLAKRLGTRQPVFGFSSRGLDGRAEFTTIEEMAAQYVSDLRVVQPRGPYHLGGYCFGGNVAYEMARRLEAQGEKVALLVLFNCAPPNSRYMRLRWTPAWCARFFRNLLYWADHCRQWTAPQRRDFLKWKWGRFKRGVTRLFGARPSDVPPVEVENLIDLSAVPEQQRELWQTHIHALMKFHPQPYAGRVHLFRSPGHPLWCSFESDYGWGEFARQGVAITVVQGAHEKILEEPWVNETAAELTNVLEASRESAVDSRKREMTPEEENLILVEWNRTEKDYPRDKTLIQLFLEQAARTPEAEALVCGTNRLTYRELSGRATSVARRLRDLGVGRDTLVGICLERSEDMVAGILGTLLAGGAYVPLDPAYPKTRLEFIVKDAEMRVVLTRRKLRDLLPAVETQFLCVEDLDPVDDQAAPAPAAGPRDLAYVLYTSGSTGQPKGVALEHRGAVALVSWAREVFAPDEISGVLASTSICFDLSVFELFVPLSWGGKIILADNALALPGLPAANEVTLINTVPSAIRELLRINGVPPSVRVINLAGEPLATALVDQIYRETPVHKVYDLYGPTETTTYSTFTLRHPGESPTIGRPLSNEQVYILDEQLQPVPIGTPGDLYIGGIGLARGYLNRPELTAERFLPNPFRAGTRLYKTGDIARWREDGNLVYLGRSDHQVKIRGFRIELAEIESALKSYSGVTDAVVIAREDRPGEKRLVAYIVASAGGEVAAEELRRAVREKLPDYMTPVSFVFLPKLPLTPNGKLDRNALPAPQDKQRDTNSGFVPPRTALEAQVAAIWSEVLGQDTVGATDDFFELGGNSLLAIQVISRLRSVFTVELPLSCLFETRTVESLASGLEAGRWRQNGNPVPPLEPIPRDRALPAAFIQEQLWFLNQLEPDSDAYNVPAAIRLKGRLDTGALQKSFDKILQRHDALRTTLHCSDGNLTQSVAPSLAVAIGVIDVPGRSEARMTELLQAEARRPFDLARGPLVRASLIRLDELDHALIIVMHHAVTDGWSLDIVFRELEASYQALAAGNPAPNFSALPVQYADFAFWQRRWMQGDVRQRGLLYWKENLAGAPLTLDLPTDQIGAVHPTNMAARVAINLPETLRAEVVSLARNEGGTNFMVLMTALAVALHKWTGQADMILGTVVAGRNRREVEGLVGCFMNFLPLRVNFAGLETGLDAFRTVKAKVIDGQTHQDCPFESMVESVTVERRPGRNPLYNVALLFQNSPAMPKLGHGLESSAIPVHVDAALLDLRFEANETADGIALMCEYKAELFHPATIDELLASFRSVLETLTRSPGTKIADFEMTAGLTRPQPQTIAVCGTFTAEPLEEPLRFWLDELEIPGRIKFAPYDQVFQQLLNPASVLSANHHGLNVLLIRLSDWESHPGAPEGQGPSTFGQAIKHNADEFVRAIHSATARGGAPILICFCPPPRRVASDPSRVQSLADLETALAVALAGLEGVCVTPTGELAALYPVADYDDPESEELGHIPYSPVFFTAVATLVARKFHALLSPPCKVIALDCDQTLWSGVCGEDGPRGLRLDAPRLALQKFMRRQQEGGKLLVVCSKNDEADVNAVFAEGAPMPLNREHFTAWRVNWRPKSENLKAIAVELKLGLDSFVLIDDNPVECAEVEAHCPEVLTLQLPEDPALIPQFLDHCWVFDQLKTTDEDRDRTAMYQQNRLRECFQTDAASFADFIASLEVEVQITPVEPAQLARVAQLTQRTNQFNASGRRRSERELRQLGGRREILTVSVRDRFGDYGLVGAMIFETGDGALVVDSFLLSCRALGRGVEHRMLAQLGKMARERGAEWVDIPFEKSPRNQPALDFLESVGVSFKQSHGHLHQFHFPADVAASVEFNPAGAEPSSPAASVRVNSRPAAAPRKFTRCRTIALESANVATIHERIEARAKVHLPAKGTYAAPRNQIERQLCELWQKILRVERVGIADDFFELGGHSLLAVRLFAEVEKTTGQKLPLVTLFQAPTVGELAAVLCQHQAPGSQSLLVPIQPHGSRPPLYLVHGAGGDVLWGYANLVAHMDAEQPIFALKSRGQTGEEEFHRLEDMAAFYVQALRAKQPDGPFYLGGYCFGGNVAYEMARQLQADGAQVALLALLDSAPANAGYQTVNWWRPEFPGLFARNIFYWLRDFRNVKPRDRRRFIARKLRTFGRKAARWMHGNRVAPEVDLEEVIDPAHFQAHELELWKIHLRALADHVQRPYPGTVTLFRTRGHPLLSSFAHDLRWGALAGGGVNLQMIPGSHENIFMEPHVETLAIRLTAALSEAQGRAAMENKPIALHS